MAGFFHTDLFCPSRESSMPKSVQEFESPDTAAKAAGQMEAYQQTTEDLVGEKLTLNMGPSHPATHGVLRLVLQLNGEKVETCVPHLGYLHRGMEKIAEERTYLQFIPYTDRLDYLAPLAANVGYILAVEKLMGIDAQLPPRCQYIRVIMSEISRVCDHLTCIGAFAMELGAFTAFLYLVKAREIIYQALEIVTGARLTISYVRPGGVKGDLPSEFEPKVREAITETRKVLKVAIRSKFIVAISISSYFRCVK